MIGRVQRWLVDSRAWVWGFAAVIVLGAAFAGYRAPRQVMALVIAVAGAVALVQAPLLGLYGIAAACLVVRFEIGTGSEVVLNAATVLVPIVVGVWLVDGLRTGALRLPPSRVNLPLGLFLLAGLLSLMVGSATWDPVVPKPNRLLLIQLAQWAIFAFAVGAFWMTAWFMQDVARLRRLTLFYLALAGGLAILRVFPGGAAVTRRYATFAVERSPFWLLLTALAAGQLLFNRRLSTGWRMLSVAALAAALIYAFVLERATASHWVGMGAVVGVLVWLRWPKLRWPAIVVLVALALMGGLSSAVYDFAGGDAEWAESGGSRLLLISRVIDVTMRNPITGLGPAAYRHYARMEPLLYYRAYWVDPQINSHNNYVDLFAHGGLLGLGVFLWFAVELALLGLRLTKRYTTGFEAGYVNAMVAAWAGSLVLMLFADWILPHVYNIGFPGFQASLPVWLFLGGLVALENVDVPQALDSVERGSR